MPSWAISPPEAKEGSAPAAASATTSIDVVVVLPLAPATATRRDEPMSEASAWERCSTRSPMARAAASSTLSSRMADDTTTVSTSATCAASWPTTTRAPLSRNDASTGLSAASEPLTGRPRASSSRATADMPAPPMAMRCTRPSISRGGTGAVKSKRGVGSLTAGHLGRLP